MVGVSWQSFKEIDPSKTYLAYGGYLERKTAWSYFGFLMRFRKVQKQLNTAKGLVGYAASCEFLSKKATQLAVFEDEYALKDFAHSGQHALCQEQAKASMNWIKNTTWSVLGSELPPKLEDAISRIQSQK
jgi:hypothetical protein